MKVREVLKTAQCSNVEVCGSYKHGLVTLYKGNIKDLMQILKINDILEKKNWGGINKENCFLLREVSSLSGNENGLWISVDMPNTYNHEDKDGNRLNEFI